MEENKALLRSPVGYLTVGLLGVFFFHWTDSRTVLLDGVYSLSSMVLSLVAVRVAYLVKRVPRSDRFNFGYAHFEPMLNTARTLAVLAVDMYAFNSALDTLSRGGRPVHTGPAVVYGVLASLACTFIGLRQQRTARRTHSPTLQVDARNWFTDAMISSGVGVAFGIAHCLEGSRYAWFVPYVDPTLVLVLVFAALPFTVLSLWENVPQVFRAAPPVTTQRQVIRITRQSLGCYPCRQLSVRMLAVGRVFYTLIHVVVPRQYAVTSLEDQDRIRRDIEERLTVLHPQPVADVVFTMDEQRAA